MTTSFLYTLGVFDWDLSHAASLPPQPPPQPTPPSLAETTKSEYPPEVVSETGGDVDTSEKSRELDEAVPLLESELPKMTLQNSAQVVVEVNTKSSSEESSDEVAAPAVIEVDGSLSSCEPPVPK